MNNMKKPLLFTHFLFLLLSLLGISSVSFAKSITMYEQPKVDAKVVGTADLSTGIMPIYTPKEGNWVKIADPKNGNVGWVKSNELSREESVMTYSQGTINGRKGASTYQIIQYSRPNTLTSAQAQNVIKQMKMQQQSIHRAVQQSMANMFQDMNLFSNSYPFIMPVVILPIHDAGTLSQPVSTTTSQQSLSNAPHHQIQPITTKK